MTVTHRKKVGVRYHCDACRKDVSDIARVACAVCEDFDLCVECFAAGVEVSTHKNDHPYRVKDTLSFPVFDDAWGAEEELLMMEGLEKYGMGNWADVADHIGTKTANAVEEHYYTVFVNAPTWPIPDMSITFPAEPIPRKRPAPVETSSLPGAEPTKKVKPLTSQPCNHDVAGYMPGRGEFETEYGNEIDEVCVRELTFEETDSKEDVDFKVMIMDIYNDKLDRKYERKKFIFDRGLQEYRQVTADERKKSPEEKALIAQYKAFSRLMTPDDFAALIEGLLIESQLRNRIERLQEYRRNGVCTYNQAFQFERERALRTNSKSSLPVLPPPPPLQPFVPQPSSRLPLGFGSGSNPPSRRGSTASLTGGAAAAAAAAGSSRAAGYGRSTTPPPASGATSSAAPTPGGTTSGGESASAAPAPRIRRVANPLNISEAEGVNLLTEREQALCSELRIMPRAFLAIKDNLMAAYATQGRLTRRGARKLVRIDVNKTTRLYDYFIDAQWLPPDKQYFTTLAKREAKARAAAAAQAAAEAAGGGAM
ncbi:Transcriptional adapter ada2 [Blastocladiella emersonii ATCC 22665]|nr:Transcriptional adapter ada2 [Blastocladiella emersonii ATCC 22665]